MNDKLKDFAEYILNDQLGYGESGDSMYIAMARDALGESITTPVTFLASLLWFNSNSNDGMVHLEGQDLYLHFSRIEGIAKNNYYSPTDEDRIRLKNLKKGALCEITIYENQYGRRVDSCKFLDKF